MSERLKRVEEALAHFASCEEADEPTAEVSAAILYILTNAVTALAAAAERIADRLEAESVEVGGPAGPVVVKLSDGEEITS